MYIKITDVNKTIKKAPILRDINLEFTGIWIKRKEWFGKDYAYACNMRAYYSGFRNN
jgi:hypothetical protein